MEWKDLLSEIVLFVKSTSAEVWRILVLQVYVEAAKYAFFSIVFAVLSFFLQRWAKPCWQVHKEEGDFDYFMSAVGLRIGFGLAIFISVILASAIIGRVINPEFYAIKFILDAASGN